MNRIIYIVFLSILPILKIIMNNNIFMLLFTVLFALAILLEKKENSYMYIFYFLPWTLILKFNEGQISVFTIVVTLFLLKNLSKDFKLKRYNLIPFILLMILSIIALMFNILEMNIIVLISFVINLLVMYFFITDIIDKKVLKKVIIAFSLGVITSGIVPILALKIPSLNNYLMSIRDNETVAYGGYITYRFAGLDYDPNYYSVSVLFAISMLLSYVEDNIKGKYMFLCILVVIGFLTVSKMYLFTVIFIFIYFIISFIFKEKFKVSLRKIIMISILIIVSIYFLGDYVYNIFNTRLSSIYDVDSLTTGRSQIWKTYLDYIINDFRVLFIGTGINNLYLNGRAAHNSYIILIYRFGIIGASLFISYIASFVKKVKIKNNIFRLSNLPLITILITSLSLDLIDHDIFIYLIIQAIIMININSKGESNAIKKDI